MSIVMAITECPSRSCTIFGWTFDASMWLAAVRGFEGAVGKAGKGSGDFHGRGPDPMLQQTWSQPAYPGDEDSWRDAAKRGGRGMTSGGAGLRSGARRFRVREHRVLTESKSAVEH